MTTTLTKNNGTSTLKIEFTIDGAKVNAIAAAAAERFFDGGLGDHGTSENPRTFASLTNAEKLAIIDEYVKRTLVGAARDHLATKAANEARAAAETTNAGLEL